MADLRLNNSIFLMYLATEEYKREHNISSLQFLELDKKYGILSYIADCPDVFDGMTKSEMAREIDEYIAANQ
ncbi:MAG: DUF3791 domain-containing protein [Treponema sp.]|nr:DUF3791 domain-containing protein [Treponema sp.]